MKYIRTKDGIYERVMVIRQVCDNEEVAVVKPDKVEFEPIIAQANTIEELCDEFVLWFKELDKPIQFGDFETAKQYKKAKVYGAIWTDKGLQFVARMNSEGVLELL